MSRIFLSFSFLVFAWSAHADETTCKVKGMHCQACKEMVEGKVCDQTKYSQCDVKMGEVHLITKEATAKVDEKELSAVVKDAGYSLQKCSHGPNKSTEKKSKG